MEQALEFNVSAPESSERGHAVLLREYTNTTVVGEPASTVAMRYGPGGARMPRTLDDRARVVFNIVRLARHTTATPLRASWGMMFAACIVRLCVGAVAAGVAGVLLAWLTYTPAAGPRCVQRG